ncbi:MAG: tetratricopeptide repeat protein [Acidobacteriota bacterium]
MLCAAALVACAACSERPGPRRVDPVTALYNQGKYTEVLPLLQRARAAGETSGPLMYRLGYCMLAVEGDRGAMMETWEEAERLLEAEIEGPAGATLEGLYYLAKINADQLEDERMREYARRGVEEFERDADPNSLTGEDWFRLGRMHEFLGQRSQAEAAYRRALSRLGRDPSANPIYYSLVLMWTADLDFKEGRYAQAAGAYDAALRLTPDFAALDPYPHALALLGAGRFEEAIARFDEARRSATTEGGGLRPAGRSPESVAVEAQYGADLARKAEEAAPIDEQDVDGVSIASLTDPVLTERVLDAADSFRSARDKYSYRPGDPLPSEVAQHQRRFVALIRERMIRDRKIQEFCLQQGIADLVRR